MRQIIKILKNNIGLKRTERILIFTDKPGPKETLPPEEAKRRAELRDIAHMFELTARSLCREVRFMEYPALGGHGHEPPRKLWELAYGARTIEALEAEGLMRPMLSKRLKAEDTQEAERIIYRYRRGAVDAVVGLSNYSTSHTGFRRLLTSLCGARYASMPLFDASMLMPGGPLDIDTKALSIRTKALASAISRATAARVTTPEGTDITFSLKGRKAHADTGVLRARGSFGNLPAGEAYIAPVEGTAEGRLVILWAPTRRLKSPVTVHMRGGLAVGVEGTEPYAGELWERLSARAENKNLAELGVGTNDRARRPDNILESEKILGTVHLAFGDNSSFGGKVKAPLHQDFVFFRPTLALYAPGGDESIILREGHLLI